jgi:hypothetical protein
MDKLIFLDVDGVLNAHEWVGEAESCDVRRDCVSRLNRIIRETGAKVVISSAWRYMVLGGAMTLDGFAYMLRTHGLTAGAEIIGLTCPDEQIPLRGDQIADWLFRRQVTNPPPRYVVLDDDDGGGVIQCQGRHDHPFVHVDGSAGLTDADADRAIAILNAGPAGPEVRTGLGRNQA